MQAFFKGLSGGFLSMHQDDKVGSFPRSRHKQCCSQLRKMGGRQGAVLLFRRQYGMRPLHSFGCVMPWQYSWELQLLERAALYSMGFAFGSKMKPAAMMSVYVAQLVVRPLSPEMGCPRIR